MKEACDFLTKIKRITKKQVIKQNLSFENFEWHVLDYKTKSFDIIARFT